MGVMPAVPRTMCVEASNPRHELLQDQGPNKDSAVVDDARVARVAGITPTQTLPIKGEGFWLS